MPYLISALFLAGTAAATPVDNAKKSKDDTDRVICRHIEETGSRLGSRKTCMKQSQWEAERRDAQDRVAAEQQRRH